MRMIQYDVKLNRDNGTGYYVSNCTNEDQMRYFNDGGRSIKMKILSHHDDLISKINVFTIGPKEIKEKLEKELQNHLEELFIGKYLDWRLTSFEVCAECVLLEYYKPDGGLTATVELSAANVFQVEFDVPGRNRKTMKRHRWLSLFKFHRILGRDEKFMEKYMIQQSNKDYGDGRIYSSTKVVEQINGVVRDLWFTHDTDDDKPFADRYVTITEYVG